MNIQVTNPALTADLIMVKRRQQAAWSSGDYAVIGTTLQIVGESLCEAVDLRSNQRVLDVAAGNGNATLAAARRFAEVVSTDYVGALLDRGRERAEADACRSPSSRPMPRTCRLRTQPSMSCFRPSASCSRRTSSMPRRKCCACAAPAARSAWPTGRRTASSAGCSRPSASTFRRRRV